MALTINAPGVVTITAGAATLGLPQFITTAQQSVTLLAGVATVSAPAAQTVIIAQATVTLQPGNVTVVLFYGFTIIGQIVVTQTPSVTLRGVNLPLSVQGNVVYITPGAVRIRVGGQIELANQRTATFRVLLDKPSDGTQSVVWFTYDDTAIAGIDYLPATGTLTFPRGALFGEIPITYFTLPIGESSKSFELALSHGYDLTIGTPIATCTIPSGPVFLPEQSINFDKLIVVSIVPGTVILLNNVASIITISPLTIITMAAIVSFTQSPAQNITMAQVIVTLSAGAVTFSDPRTTGNMGQGAMGYAIIGVA